MQNPIEMNRRDFMAGTAAGVAGLALSSSTGATPPVIATADRPSSPLAMWAMTGRLESADVQWQLDLFREAGWGLVLYPRWGLELEYLGQEWFDRIRFIVEQAAARSMEVWLYDEFCWPSGHAKGLVTEGHADLRAQVLEIAADGKTSLTVSSRDANLLLPQATRRFLEVTHERYARAIGDYFGNCVRAIFTDEPSLAAQHRGVPMQATTRWRLPWSERMEMTLGADFRQRLAGAGNVSEWAGWREYWAAYTQVFHDAWVAPIAAWCQSHGLAMTGHLLGEGSFGTQVAYNGSLHRQLGEFGIPGIDEINTRTDPGTCEALTLAAIAEYPGRERMVEAYALGPPSMSLETMKKMVDLCAACGVDRYIMAICPHDLRGGVFKREYLGIHGPQQPWFRDHARVYGEYAAEAAEVARKAEPLGVTWPADEELWAAAGPDPKRSKPLQAMTERVVAVAREAIRERLPAAPSKPQAATVMDVSGLRWSFEPLGLNSLRLDQPLLHVVDVPARAELSIQSQLVRSLKINGRPVDWQQAPADRQGDLSYRRIAITDLLRAGENQLDVETGEAAPLRFLPALILWGDFAVDAKGQLIKPPETVSLGDWRESGYPAFCGTGRYRTLAEFSQPPAWLTIDTGGYPARVSVDGHEIGSRAWSPLRFDLRGTAHAGRNEIVIDVTSTLGHLFVPAESPPVGLRMVECTL